MLKEIFQKIFGERVVDSSNRRINVKKEEFGAVITITAPNGKLISEVLLDNISEIENFSEMKNLSSFDLTLNQKKIKKSLTLIEELKNIPIGLSE